jgi:hypothetical protein
MGFEENRRLFELIEIFMKHWLIYLDQGGIF